MSSKRQYIITSKNKKKSSLMNENTPHLAVNGSSLSLNSKRMLTYEDKSIEKKDHGNILRVIPKTLSSSEIFSTSNETESKIISNNFLTPSHKIFPNNRSNAFVSNLSYKHDSSPDINEENLIQLNGRKFDTRKLKSNEIISQKKTIQRKNYSNPFYDEIIESPRPIKPQSNGRLFTNSFNSSKISLSKLSSNTLKSPISLHSHNHNPDLGLLVSSRRLIVLEPIKIMKPINYPRFSTEIEAKEGPANTSIFEESQRNVDDEMKKLKNLTKFNEMLENKRKMIILKKRNEEIKNILHFKSLEEEIEELRSANKQVNSEFSNRIFQLSAFLTSKKLDLILDKKDSIKNLINLKDESPLLRKQEKSLKNPDLKVILEKEIHALEGLRIQISILKGQIKRMKKLSNFEEQIPSTQYKFAQRYELECEIGNLNVEISKIKKKIRLWKANCDILCQERDDSLVCENFSALENQYKELSKNKKILSTDFHKKSIDKAFGQELIKKLKAICER